MKPIIYWGATGQAKVLQEFAGSTGYRLVALFDNNVDTESPFRDIPIYHGADGLRTWMGNQSEQVFGLAAIGGGDGKARLDIHALFAENGVEIPVAIHPTAFVAKSAVLSKGCQILAQSAVCADATLGESCIINTSSSVDHECGLGNGVHVAPGATLAGCVEVGDFSFIGAGAVVLPRIKIGSNVVVGAGAVVTKDVPDDAIVYGNPARYTGPNSSRK